MNTFTPANHLETKLKALIADQNTPYWSFYTPLAAAPLWLVVKHYPELDGSDELAPGGRRQILHRPMAADGYEPVGANARSGGARHYGQQL